MTHQKRARKALSVRTLTPMQVADCMPSVVDALKAVEAQTAQRCAEMLETSGVMLPIMPGALRHDYVARFALAFATKIRAQFKIS